MTKNHILRNSVAGILLVLFAFSITPKLVLHDWLVDHKDDISVKSAHATPHVHKAGFNCNCDNLVAESPFIGEFDHFEFTPFLVFAIQQDIVPHSLHVDTCFFVELRGPPSPQLMF